MLLKTSRNPQFLSLRNCDTDVAAPHLMPHSELSLQRQLLSFSAWLLEFAVVASESDQTNQNDATQFSHSYYEYFNLVEP